MEKRTLDQVLEERMDLTDKRLDMLTDAMASLGAWIVLLAAERADPEVPRVPQPLPEALDGILVPQDPDSSSEEGQFVMGGVESLEAARARLASRLFLHRH